MSKIFRFQSFHKTLIFVILVLFPFPSLSQDDGAPVPLFLLFEMDPWLTVVGSDSPSFAVYQTGQIIFLNPNGGPGDRYLQVNLSQGELEAFMTSLGINETFDDMQEEYQVSFATDEVSNYFYFNTGEIEKTVGVYGPLVDLQDFSKVPEKLVILFNKIKNFSPAEAVKWFPEKFEVMIWDYSNAPEESVVWPDDWPDLNSPETWQRDEGSYSLFVDSSHFEEFLNLLQKRKTKGAIEINGGKWAVAYRLPFPHER